MSFTTSDALQPTQELLPSPLSASNVRPGLAFSFPSHNHDASPAAPRQSAAVSSDDGVMADIVAFTEADMLPEDPDMIYNEASSRPAAPSAWEPAASVEHLVAPPVAAANNATAVSLHAEHAEIWRQELLFATQPADAQAFGPTSVAESARSGIASSAASQQPAGIYDPFAVPDDEPLTPPRRRRWRTPAPLAEPRGVGVAGSQSDDVPDPMQLRKDGSLDDFIAAEDPVLSVSRDTMSDVLPANVPILGDVDTLIGCALRLTLQLHCNSCNPCGKCIWQSADDTVIDLRGSSRAWCIMFIGIAKAIEYFRLQVWTWRCACRREQLCLVLDLVRI